MKYAIYPFDVMRITQRHDEGNHLAHWSPFKNCSDKPWDEACDDGNRGYFVPKNDYKVVEKTGSQKSGYNVRLESTEKLLIPFQNDSVIVEVTLTHLNNDDWSKLKVGQIIKSGQKIIREGTSGQASGNHLHCTVNFGKYYGFQKNGNGKYCFVYEKSLTPDEAWYIDDSVKVIDSKGYEFKKVPDMHLGNPVAKNTKIDQINVKVTDLRARKDPYLNGSILGFIKKGFYDIQDKKDAEGYTWYKVQDMWIAYKKEWADLLYHEQTKEEIQKDYMNKIIENIPEFLRDLIEK